MSETDNPKKELEFKTYPLGHAEYFSRRAGLKLGGGQGQPTPEIGDDSPEEGYIPPPVLTVSLETWSFPDLKPTPDLKQLGQWTQQVATRIRPDVWAWALQRAHRSGRSVDMELPVARWALLDAAAQYRNLTLRGALLAKIYEKRIRTWAQFHAAKRRHKQRLYR